MIGVSGKFKFGEKSFSPPSRPSHLRLFCNQFDSSGQKLNCRCKTMRAGLSTIQQTLTPEAANVLNHSIAEAARRNHGQTTPLHVAATLLASPSGYLRQACIRSHPNSSHPLQCRALELCFSVALERLPTAQNTSPGAEPPISNALMAALKRAQAHQRRGCPEQQQQPLLAVKVELEQLIISILDDPSVSRVMREASFSSPAVKATIEQLLNSPTSSAANGLGFRPAPTPNRSMYLNPRLQQGGVAQSGHQRAEEVKRVIDILLRTKKKNPVLVGESEPDAVVKQVLRRIENKEFGDGPLKNVGVIHLDKDMVSDRAQLLTKIKELGNLIETQIANSVGGVILDLGDLKWLVEQVATFGSKPGVPQQVVTEMGSIAVTEMGKLLSRFGGGSGGRFWLIGTATCETYLRCQVYHPTMENDWDLQAVPIAARAPLPGLFPRLGTSGILSSSVESLTPLKCFSTTDASPRCMSENLDPARRISCCPQCMESYEQELAELVAKEFERSSSEIKSEAARPQLPQWLQTAKASNIDVKTSDLSQTKDQEVIRRQKTKELQMKWKDTCMHLHPNFHQSLGSERIAPTALPMTGLYNRSLLRCQPFQPKLQITRDFGGSLQLNVTPVASQPAGRAEWTSTPPGSPVKTELVLGRAKVTETTPNPTPDKTHKERIKNFMGCISSETQNSLHDLRSNKILSTLDADSFKKLLKGLIEKVWWQREAASAVAATVTECKLGNGKRRGAGSKGDIWLLFMGPDRVGKKKMALVLSELVCGANPITISLGSQRNNNDEDLDMNFRGKTALDRIGEAVRRNPFSVVMLEDIDEADMLVRGSIKWAMERGRLTDSHGREISLGNVIFILTANWLPDSQKNYSSKGVWLDEEKLATLAGGCWQLRLIVSEKTGKRRANWLNDDDDDDDKNKCSTKARKEMVSSGLSFDLNEAVADGEDGSRNSSDLTMDHDEEHGLSTTNKYSPTTSAFYLELLDSVDDAIVFKPVDLDTIRCKIASSISTAFSKVNDDDRRLSSIQVQEEALEKILGGVWLGRTGLEEWSDKVLVPSLNELKAHLRPSNAADEAMVVRLEHDGDWGSRSYGDWLPSKIKLAVDG